jgi:K+-transporting ATPase A subunit
MARPDFIQVNGPGLMKLLLMGILTLFATSTQIKKTPIVTGIKLLERETEMLVGV